jgi:HlyD family secretion protein
MNVISRPRHYGLWIVIAMVSAGGAFYWVKQVKQVPPTTLETAAVTRGSVIESIASTGSLTPQEEVTVGTQISGTITKVLVDFNSTVKKGDLLAVVDPQTLQAQLITAKASLLKAQAQYNEAIKQLNEGKPLREQGYLSMRDMRTLEVSAETAHAQLDSAQADYNRQNVQLTYAEVRSPIDGIVESRTVDPGNTVQAAMTAPTLFVIASDLARMKILATVDETQIASITEGMKARFTVSGIADRVFRATVNQVRLKSTITSNVVTYTVVLDAENPDKLLFPGMTATIDFILSNIEDKLLVPSAALRVRVPNELRVESDRQPDQASQSAGADGAQYPQRGAMAAGGPGPGGRGGGMRPGMGMPGAAAQKRGVVWVVGAAGLARRVPVRILGNDLTATAVEALEADRLSEGDMIVTKVVEPAGGSSSSSSQSQQNRNNQMMIGGPGGFGGGR